MGMALRMQKMGIETDDALSKAAQNLSLLQAQKFSGAVEVRLELFEGGIRACYFTTTQKIHPQERKGKIKK